MNKVLDTSGYTGSGTFYRHQLMRGYVYTEGVQYVAETAGAYWLIDLILSHQLNPAVRKEEFQVWTLKVTDGTAVATMTDGNTETPKASQDIEFTDFPAEGITMWLENNTLYLPSER